MDIWIDGGGMLGAVEEVCSAQLREVLRILCC